MTLRVVMFVLMMSGSASAADDFLVNDLVAVGRSVKLELTVVQRVTTGESRIPSAELRRLALELGPPKRVERALRVIRDVARRARVRAALEPFAACAKADSKDDVCPPSTSREVYAGEDLKSHHRAH